MRRIRPAPRRRATHVIGVARTGGTVIALLVVAAHARAQAVATLPLRSGEATFHIRATIVNDFTGRVPVSRAAYAGTDLATLSGSVEIRVEEMRTGIGLRDRHLRAAMEAERFPLMRFDLARVEAVSPRGDSLDVDLVGRLTIHGTERELRIPGEVLLGRDSIVVRTAFPVDMRDYGIKPPVKMLGTLRVAPGVEVGIRLVFAPAPPETPH